MKQMFCKRFLFTAIIFYVSIASYGQEVVLTVHDTGAYSFVERSDWRRYDNGKYTGLVSREVRASILPDKTADGGFYYGNYIVLEKTQTGLDWRHSAKPVNAVVPVRFQLKTNGDFSLEEDQGLPSLRGFPVFPVKPIVSGSGWSAMAQRTADPLNAGHPVLLKIPVEYTYKGIENYKGVQVHRISAKYSSGTIADPNPFEIADFTSVQGLHNVDILLRVSNGLPILIIDDFDETFTLNNGSSLRFVGKTNTFTEGLLPMNKESVITAITAPIAAPPPLTNKPVSPPETVPAKKPSGLGEGVDVVEVPEGVKLTVKDIRFKPDSDEFLPSENRRLDNIASALKQIPERTFLVEGHTADTGRSSSEMNLSIRRAKRMIEELVKRGIAEDRFLYKGWGGSKPISDNATEAGRVQNRRVEITILE